MLGWFVPCDVTTKASRLVKHCDASDLEKESERVPVKHTEVDLRVIQVYFSSDPWQAILHLVDIVKWDSVWLCFTCKWALDTSASIGCERSHMMRSVCRQRGIQQNSSGFVLRVKLLHNDITHATHQNKC